MCLGGCAAIFSMGALFPLVAMPRRAGPELRTLEPTKPGDPGTPHASIDRNGEFETKDGLTLRLSADLGRCGSLRWSRGAPAVRYSVHIETDARAPLAQALLDKYVLRAKASERRRGNRRRFAVAERRGAASGAQFWVQFEVAVPAGYNLDVKTDAGDIETQDIGGTAMLTTQGGNIRTGRIGMSGMQNSAYTRRGAARSHALSKLRTEGGHIQVQDVAGDLNAFTGGGHINAGNIAGDAKSAQRRRAHSGGANWRPRGTGYRRRKYYRGTSGEFRERANRRRAD